MDVGWSHKFTYFTAWEQAHIVSAIINSVYSYTLYVKASCMYDRKSLVGASTAQSSSLTAALVSSSPAGTSVVASGPPALPSSSLAAVPVLKSEAPPSYVYDNSKTYAVLDNCNGSSTSAATVAHCQTTNDAALLVTYRRL